MATLSEVAANIKAQAQKSPDHAVSVTDKVLGWSGSQFASLVIDDLLRAAGNIILIIDPAVIPDNPSGDSFEVPVDLPASVADSFLNLHSIPGTAIFIAGPTRIELQLELELGSGWTLADSFPELTGVVLTELALQAPRFLFSTSTRQTGEPGFDAATGLNLLSVVALASQFAPLARLLQAAGYQPPVALELMGTVTQTPAGADIEIAASLGLPTIDLDVIALKNATMIAGLSWSDVTGIGTTPDSGLGFAGEVDLENAAGDEVAVQVIARMPITSMMPFVRITVLPARQFSTSLDKLGALLGGASWDDFFSGPAAVMKPYLDVFGLRYFVIDLVTTSAKALSWVLSVGTLSKWPVIPSKLEVDEFQVNFANVGPGATVGITADVTLFESYRFSAGISLPDVLIAAELEGAVELDIKQWLDKIATEFDPGTPVPPYVLSALEKFTLTDVRFALDQPAGSLQFALAGAWAMIGHEFDFFVGVQVSEQPGGYRYDIGGSLEAGAMTFTGEFSSTGSGSIFRAAWSTPNPVSVDLLASSFGFAPPAMPADLDLAIKSAELVFDVRNDIIVLAAASGSYGAASFVALNSPTAGWQFFFGVDIDRQFNLSDLPLVGQQLAHLQTISIDRIEALLSNAAIGPAESKQIAGLIGGDYPKPPVAGIGRGIALGMDIDFGETSQHVSLGVGPPDDVTGEPPRALATLGRRASWPVLARGEYLASEPGGDDGVTWFQIQKSFGPVTFQRIGVKYADEVVSFLIDGAMSVGGLAVDLLGLTIASPLSTFDPHFDLQGLGIDYNNGALSIGGGFLNVPAAAPDSWEYAGDLVVQAGEFDLSAVGSYADVAGSPSMFIFAELEGALGGPPYFFITGLMGGFGFNRSLRVPGQDEVFSFPFVRGLTDPGAVGGKAPTPLEVLAKLEEGQGGNAPWVTIDAGQTWIAAGLQFTSFEVVEGKALAVVEFGRELQLALLGLASSRFPQHGTTVYAYVELQLLALYKPDEGTLFFSALLSANSYVLDPSCRLTGGFAFELWFDKSDHEGDFVVTLGGYNAYFNVPRWYPGEPRLGFNWSLDSNVTISGESYFALTPSAIMAGGALDVLFHAGNLQAWFSANADFVIYFKPFSFAAHVGISVGASYRMNLRFVTKTFRVELSADLDLWGPPTGGVAKIHWWVISFTVHFGSGQGAGEAPLNWSEFSTLLPVAENVVKSSVSTGLSETRRPNADLLLLGAEPAAGAWVVRADRFSFDSVSAIPASDIYVGYSETRPFETGKLLDIRPMQRTELTSSLRLWVTRSGGSSGGSEVDLLADGWKLEVLKNNVPKALWGKGKASLKESGTDALIANQLVGLSCAAPPPALGPTPGAIDAAQDLSYEPLPPGTMPLETDPPPSGPVAVEDRHSVGQIQSTIMSAPAVANRAQLYGLLQENGWAPGDDGNLSNIAADAGLYFEDPPMVVSGTV